MNKAIKTERTIVAVPVTNQIEIVLPLSEEFYAAINYIERALALAKESLSFLQEAESVWKGSGFPYASEYVSEFEKAYFKILDEYNAAAKALDLLKN